MLLRTTLAALCCAAFSLAASAADSLPASVQAALKANKLPADGLSVAIVALNDGKPVLQYQAERPVNPASTMKLVTTYSALGLLGPAWQWQTDLLSDAQPVNGVLNGNLYLRGSGDPKLTIERVWQWLRDLKAAGVTDIKGKLVLDRSLFMLPPDSGFDDDGNGAERPFMVDPDAALTNFKSIRLLIDSTGDRVRLTAEPPLPEVRVSNELAIGRSGNCEAWSQRVNQRLGQMNNLQITLQLAGEVPAGCRVERYVAVMNAQTYTAALVRQLWRELGGQGIAGWSEGATPASALVLASTKSQDVANTIRDINKYSNNMMARQLFLTLGAQSQESGDTPTRAATAIKSWLGQQGLRFDELTLENGSGLSRHERISSAHLAQLLVSANRSRFAAEFISSLPIVAIDGTMRKRLKRDDIAAHIKTGTLKDVKAVAGYVRDADGVDWAVVAIANHPRAPQYAPVLDEILRWIANAPTSELAALRATR
ncbi:D-alanyl-D-alanine carboxypeptidase / D-alanyl-D-alanine-endopeptidase (penicillin-binding protein 4) [Andreprevotia lacus DSM 23236]|jgi:D-alanyl-D-alanine carboxypeptidase/D-alanyl-D-alanine-endopeptidase (penicillin-binding protein 4)|uniref:D-alanyl-D-alanine carboxypeptidase / D-alanyl-D-alanine-endopeptidase (Penicillin-binding protein 4) n=1 Tax=Andreprevotia lacus DSM 23236 TaxID=1121001 RepID=A0A1W1XYT6_9NEIS|nr:D-alanyl-D-alanine carboxypeptidase/D-alanyl-D-alanine-endopeptidase [Andreprevotia lacus]SMC29017.1 D-alanyl-D-alanine carboxypeptidase / D-alanyl-D-alanine-endopeptidase (penicillin-binding protein 4) [Andreprevotia lacus DSM 23236]